MNADHTASRINGAKQSQVLDVVYYHTTRCTRPDLAQSRGDVVVNLSFLERSSHRLKSITLVLLESLRKNDLEDHGWLLTGASKLENLIIHGARRSSEMWADDTRCIFDRAPFGGDTPCLRSIDISAFFLPMAGFSNLTDVAIARIRFHKGEAVADLVGVLESSPNLLSFSLEEITLPATTLKHLRTSKILFPGLERLNLQSVETAFVRYLMDRICAPSNLKIRVGVDVNETDTLEDIFPSGFHKSPGAVMLQYAKFATSRAAHAGMAIRLEASESKFEKAEEASFVVVLTGSVKYGFLKRIFSTLKRVLPRSLTSLALHSFKAHGHPHSIPNRHKFAFGLARYSSLTEVTLTDCHDGCLRAFSVSEAPLCPLLQKLRVEGELEEGTLELVVLSRAGTPLRRVEIANCRPVKLSTVSRLMEFVEEVELDGVESVDDLA
ncbi:hypothetical protein BOTBODRAFT_61500 [Botryobasidium botryosum FD-172 SS1]|uniref:F-box domain-containing protein n=1 Tax=Botryobasidium botryosum (strain FD-172 SS1) TaxID=930990 RepID=A0A067N1Q6_BOTB1|nr:hypothetical protein BOTBODRAFT_61500 [Botryobasidium botryosum FD-172 SS1]